MKTYLFVFVILLQPLTTVHSEDFYVSPSGNDRNTGTRNHPFQTIGQAQKSVRSILDAGQESDITVWIDDGIYQISESLKFGPGDSGQGLFRVKYRAVNAGKPVISGGMVITGWKKSGKGYWKAEVPSASNRDQKFRELFIDGKRAVRARHPNDNYLQVASVGADRRTNFHFNQGDFPEPDVSEKVEVVLLHDWSVSRIPVDEIDYRRLKITATDSIGAMVLDFFNLDNWEKHPRYFLENSKAFMDSPGEWFLDSEKGFLYLMMAEGETPEDYDIIAPVTGPHLIEISGTKDHTVKNLEFHGLSFKYCSWLLTERGYAGIQACFFDPRPAADSWSAVPAAGELNWAENCSFTSCNFMHLGGSGLWLGAGVSGCVVSGSVFSDISGNGIMLGEGRGRKIEGEHWWKKAPDQVAEGNTISANTVTGCGKQFYGAVGIWCGFTAGTTVSDNHLYNLPYTGISIGWEWSSIPTPCRDNHLTGNHIHHVMETLSDGGGIYVLGLQPGSSVSDNLIHDVYINMGRAESNGMFLDEGTKNMTISGNIIYNIAMSPLRFHRASINLVKDNILSCRDKIPPVRYNNTPETNIRLVNNHILQDFNPEHQKLLKEATDQWKSR